VSGDILAPLARGRITLVIDLHRYDARLLEPGAQICADVWIDGAGMVHALSGEVVSVSVEP
jgi:hypothetical protein